MDRRFFLFLTLSLGVLIAHGIWIRSRRPVPAPAPAAEQAADAAAGRVEAGADGAKQDELAEAKARPKEDAVAKGDAVDDEPDQQEDAKLEAAQAETPPQYVTLGSLDEKSGYRMLVTLTDRGAAVRRIELASPRYLDMHDRGGYLGQLELDGGESGLAVRAVGAGTPAAAAGLKAGDLLLEAGAKETKPLVGVEDFERLLKSTRPGRSLTLIVKRGQEKLTLPAVKLVRRPMELIRPEKENLLVRGERPEKDFPEPPSFLMTLESVDAKRVAEEAAELAGVRLRNAAWQIVPQKEDHAVVFRREIPKYDLAIEKRYALAQASGDQLLKVDAPVYHLELEVTLTNLSKDKTRKAAYRLDGPNGLPVEGWWFLNKTSRKGVGGMRDLVGRYFGASPQQQGASVIAAGQGTDFEGAAMAYMCVDSHYFSVALLPDKKESDQGWTAAVKPLLLSPEVDPKSGQQRFANVSFRVIGQPWELKPGASATHKYRIFAGPKRPSLLSAYVAGENLAYTLGDFNYYGWFSAISQALIGILHGFYAVVRNYGVAIVLLTVLVRGCLFPITRGQARSMAKLQALKPEMDKIKEKFKTDQPKQAQAMQQLYRKHGVNPLGGCLPAFLQLPVMMALWRGLAQDVELRQAPLLSSAIPWCSNLAAPDMLWNWSKLMPASVCSGQGFLGLGPYLNILPLATIGLFLWQQKMFMPQAADDQAKMQQSMMKWMSVLMSLMFYKVPSGLCIYLITSSLWSIAERKLVPPVISPGGTPSGDGPGTVDHALSKAKTQIAGGTSPAAKEKSPGLWQRLLDAAEKQRSDADEGAAGRGKGAKGKRR